jgi:hypothetical protein
MGRGWRGAPTLATPWWQRWRLDIAVLGTVAAAVITLDEIDYPSGWWTDSHVHHRHAIYAIAAIIVVAAAAIFSNIGQEFAESRKAKSLARKARIEQILGVILANIVEHSIDRLEESLRNFGNELHGQSDNLAAQFDALLTAQRLPSITKMAAYYYQLRRLLWQVRLVRRARFSIGTDRPEPIEPRYRLGQDSIGKAARKEDVAWQRVPTPGGSSVVINSTPLFSNGVLIGILAIVAEPGDKMMEDRLLDRAMTERLAGWRTALTKVVEHAP